MSFDLDAAKAGKSIRDAVGRPALFVAHVIEGVPSPLVVVVINQRIETYTEQGWYLPDRQGHLDLHTTAPEADSDDVGFPSFTAKDIP